MNKAQEIWDSAHPVKIGQTLKPGTEFVRVDNRDHYGWVKEVSIHTVRKDELLEITDDYAVQFFRTVDPLPDPDDTGTLTVHSDAGVIVLVDTYDDRCYDLSENQARNLARKLTEALDGH